MFRKLFSAYKIFIKSKIIFKKPKHKNIILFEQEGSGELKNILKNKEFFLLADRLQHLKKIYLFPELIYLFFKNYNKNLKTTYLASLLEVIKPKIVITFIDNSNLVVTEKNGRLLKINVNSGKLSEISQN